MKVEDLTKHATLYEIAKLLGMTPPSTYKWKKTGVPLLRVYQLKELKPHWFQETQNVDLKPE